MLFIWILAEGANAIFILFCLSCHSPALPWVSAADRLPLRLIWFIMGLNAGWTVESDRNCCCFPKQYHSLSTVAVDMQTLIWQCYVCSVVAESTQQVETESIWMSRGVANSRILCVHHANSLGTSPLDICKPVHTSAVLTSVTPHVTFLFWLNSSHIKMKGKINTWQHLSLSISNDFP